MTPEDYKKAKTELECLHKQQLQALAKEYAFSNKKFDVGDLITNGATTIKVDTVKWSCGFDEPYVVYVGYTVTKKGKPTARPHVEKVAQTELVKRIDL